MPANIAPVATITIILRMSLLSPESRPFWEKAATCDLTVVRTLPLFVLPVQSTVSDTPLIVDPEAHLQPRQWQFRARDFSKSRFRQHNRRVETLRSRRTPPQWRNQFRRRVAHESKPPWC